MHPTTIMMLALYNSHVQLDAALIKERLLQVLSIIKTLDVEQMAECIGFELDTECGQ